MLAPAIGGSTESVIPDFKYGADESAETRERRIRPHLALDNCGEVAFGDQKGHTAQHRSKQLLNDDADVDIGIGRVTPFERSDSLDYEDFRCLSRLGRKRSSPLRRLLEDVDMCLLTFMESVQVVASPNRRLAALKVEAKNELTNLH